MDCSLYTGALRNPDFLLTYVQESAVIFMLIGNFTWCAVNRQAKSHSDPSPGPTTEVQPVLCWCMTSLDVTLSTT